jgi:hypothetical protein
MAKPKGAWRESGLRLCAVPGYDSKFSNRIKVSFTLLNSSDVKTPNRTSKRASEIGWICWR